MEFTGVHWGLIGILVGHWGSVKVIGGSVGLSGARGTMHIHLFLIHFVM